jgi:ribosomal protein S18 acetylase RimI-like enzyme
VTRPAGAASKPRQPEEYVVRPAARADFDRIVAMLHDADIADWGEPDFTAEFLEFEWSMPQLDLRTDTWLAERDAAEEVCAYTWLLARDEHRQLDGWGVVHPDHRGRGLGWLLLDLIEARAREHAALAPGGGTTLRWGVIAPDRAAHSMLEARGFVEERHSWAMETRVGADGAGAAEPAPPAGVTIRPFDPETDAAAVHASIEESFTGHYAWVPRPFEEWAAMRMERQSFDPGLWRVAVSHEDGVVGALIGVITEGKGFIETLGVVPAWRGRGVGLVLLRSSFAEFGRRGIETVALDVDSENATGAVALYERAGMHVTRQFDTFAKHIDPPS